MPRESDDAEENGSTEAGRVPLDYAMRRRRPRRPFTIGRPIPRMMAGLLIGIWSTPMWGSIFVTNVDAYYMRPICDAIVATVLGLVVFIILIVRWFAITRHEDRPTRQVEMITCGRIAIVAATSLTLLWLDANAIGVQIAFRRHRATFEAAKTKALTTLAPGESAPHGAIGPFPFVRVERGLDGVAFKLAGGSGIEFGNETLLVPPGDGGPLGGGWRWEATD